MLKPALILDPHWRRIDELFHPSDLRRLGEGFELVWAKDEKMPDYELRRALPEAFAYACARPEVDAAFLDSAPQLRAIAETSGTFPDTIDYEACAERGVEVLCCAPGFRRSVAEMALAMCLASGRGLVQEHELFRSGGEHWLSDNEGRDFTLYDQAVGFVGFGQIARETLRLMRPFGVDALAYDPWLPEEAAEEHGMRLCGLDELFSSSRFVLVMAAPSKDNEGLVDKRLIDLMPDGALLTVISRAHLVNFGDLCEAAQEGRIRIAIDVFPEEPLAEDHPLRSAPNVILSPHRAAAVYGGRHLIGKLLTDDLIAVKSGGIPCGLQRAADSKIASVAGIGNAVRSPEIDRPSAKRG